MDLQQLILSLEQNIYNKTTKENYDESNDNYNEEQESWDVLLRCKKQTDKNVDNIFKKLEELMLSQEIFDLVKKYFDATITYENNKKKKLRNTIMCGCVYLAFSKMKDFRDEEKLKKFFNASDERYTAAIKMIKLAVPELRYIKTTHENYVYKICDVLGILEDIDSIKSFVSDFSKTEYGINLMNYSKVKLQNIYYIGIYPWLIINKSNIVSPRKYSSLTGISKKSIIKCIEINEKLKKYLYEKYHRKINIFLIKIQKKNDIKNNVAFSYDDLLKLLAKNIKLFSEK